MDHSDPLFQKAIRRPVASPDDEVIAIPQSTTLLNILSVETGHSVVDISLHSSLQQSLGDLQNLYWSPKFATLADDGIDLSRRQLLLTFPHHIKVFAVDMAVSERHGQAKSRAIANYDAERHVGKIMLARFVLDSQHILILLETGTHASILSLSDSSRTDVPLPKFSDLRGFTESPLKNAFAFLIRSQGHDHVAVFELSNGILSKPVIFATGTSDAQGIVWSPNGDPVLAVWDSAAYGTRIRFYTALGHQLQQLAIEGGTDMTVHNDLIASGIGVSRFTWSKSALHETVIVVANGQGGLFVRGQNNQKLKTALLALFNHISTVDGQTYIIWQEAKDHSFSQQEVAIDLHFDLTTPAELIEWNSDQTLLASKIKAFPQGLWIWQMRRVHPLTVLIFEHEVRQAAWHPSNPSVLLITTNSKQPLFFCWHDVQLSPQVIQFGQESSTSTANFNVSWHQAKSDDRARLLVSSPTSYGLGLLQRQEDTVVFESILHNQAGDDLDETEIVDTPSKASRHPAAANNQMSMGALEPNLVRATDNLW